MICLERASFLRSTWNVYDKNQRQFEVKNVGKLHYFVSTKTVAIIKICQLQNVQR